VGVFPEYKFIGNLLFMYLVSFVCSLLCFISRRVATMSCNRNMHTGLSSTITLNDGVVMPMFGLGTYKLCNGDGSQTETVASFALENGYRLLDTAAFYRCGPDLLFHQINLCIYR